MPRLQLADWQAQQCRLTVFPMPDATARSPQWWEQVTNSEPDENVQNPKKGSSVITGSFGSGQLILKLEPERIDWHLIPARPDSNEDAPAFPIVGVTTEVFDQFSFVAERWLSRNDLPSIARMAFGTVLVHPEADRTTAYERLPLYVPVQVDPESSDFLYQINLPQRPSATGIAGLRLNRLSKWSVSAFKSLALQFSGVGVATQEFPEAFAFRLELDINTVPAFTGPIPAERLVDVYHELMVIGREIATNGVIPE